MTDLHAKRLSFGVGTVFSNLDQSLPSTTYLGFAVKMPGKSIRIIGKTYYPKCWFNGDFPGSFNPFSGFNPFEKTLVKMGHFPR